MGQVDEHFVAQYRQALRQPTFDFRVLREMCERCSQASLDDVVEILEEVSAKAIGNLVDRTMVARLLAFHKEWRERRDRAWPARGRSLADLPFLFTHTEVAAWHKLAMEFVAAKPSSYGALLMLTESFLVSGMPWIAEPYYARIRTLAVKDDPASAVNFATDFHAALENMAAEVLSGVLSARTWIEPVTVPLEFAVFVACDYVYLEKYGWQLVTSWVEKSSATTLVLHLYDVPDAKIDEVRKRLASLIGGRSLALSIEYTGFAEGPQESARGYYHAVRFLRFHQFLEENPGVHAWLIDADMSFNRDPEALLHALRDQDVALWLMPGRVEINNQIAAGLVGVAPTVRGREYMRRVAGYIGAYARADILPWGIDQVALFMVATEMSNRGACPAIAPVTFEIFDGTRDGSVVLWPTK